MKEGVEDMSDKNTQLKLADLYKRANAIKADPNLRHIPNEHDLSIASENAKLMQPYQYQTINKDGDKS